MKGIYTGGKQEAECRRLTEKRSVYLFRSSAVVEIDFKEYNLADELSNILVKWSLVSNIGFCLEANT